MIIVSGCPRSGTSLMMDLMRVALGEGRILGEKWPQQKRVQALYAKHEGEDENARAARIYLFEKQNPNWESEFKETQDMNPNGFWECPFTVKGVQDSRRLSRLLEQATPEKVCKIVSQGLAGSDPKYIDKVVFMLRHPRAVAKSQERLKRQMPFKASPPRKQQGLSGVRGQGSLEENMRIHTPEMFIRVSVAVAHWFLEHPQVRVHQVLFDDLVERPQPTLAEVGDFLGEGDWQAAASRIEPKLRRSEPQEIDHELWEDAEFVYGKMLARDYQGVMDYFADQKKERATQRAALRWQCPRAGQIVTDKQCEPCRENPVVRGNFRDYAQRQGIDWRKEPCLYEVAYGPQSLVKITIEQSVAQNHWVEPGMEVAVTRSCANDKRSQAVISPQPRGLRSRLAKLVGR